jgi:hypothetical protein
LAPVELPTMSKKLLLVVAVVALALVYYVRQ